MGPRLTSFSRADACAHLLRHLSDPVALRENPLVEHLFPERGASRTRLVSAQREALAEVRRLVRAAAEALRGRERHGAAAAHTERQYAILIRCDLQQERHGKVADDLGLSLSQFYRERRAARAWVAEYFAQYHEDVKPVATGATTLDSFVFDIAYAQTLRSAGEYDRAVDMLQTLSERLDRPAQRLEVYCLLVQFLSDARRYGSIHLALQAARECFANLRLSREPDLERHRGRLEMAIAAYHWAFGEPSAALEANNQAIEAFRAVRFKPGSDGEEPLANALLDLAYGYLSVGRFQDGNAALAQTRSIIDDLPTPHPRLRASFLVGLGYLQTNTLETMNEGVATLRAALALAQSHRFGKEAISAMAGLSLHAQFHGDYATAYGYIRECLQLGERLMTPLDHSQLLVRMLELEAIAGRPQEAFALAACLREHFAPESAGWTKTMIFLAMTLLSVGEYAKALEMSATASEVTARKNDFRLHGAALRVQAAAGAGLGLHEAARATIDRAVGILETYGSPYILLLSYEESSRITGNDRHALCARELRSAVAPPSLALSAGRP